MVASFLISTVGFGFFLYGKKQMRIPQLATGIAMMVYPYCVSSSAWMLAIAGVLLLGLGIAVRLGL